MSRVGESNRGAARRPVPRRVPVPALLDAAAAGGVGRDADRVAVVDLVPVDRGDPETRAPEERPHALLRGHQADRLRPAPETRAVRHR